MTYAVQQNCSSVSSIPFLPENWKKKSFLVQRNDQLSLWRHRCDAVVFSLFYFVKSNKFVSSSSPSSPVVDIHLINCASHTHSFHTYTTSYTQSKIIYRHKTLSNILMSLNSSWILFTKKIKVPKCREKKIPFKEALVLLLPHFLLQHQNSLKNSIPNEHLCFIKHTHTHKKKKWWWLKNVLNILIIWMTCV